MPSLSELNLPADVSPLLAPFIGDKQVSGPEDGIWVQKGRIRLELEDIGEGWNGDFDEEDEDDQPLLRFTFLAQNPKSDDQKWFSLDETSYCTAIDANACWEVRLALACQIFDEAFDKLEFRDDDREIEPEHGRNAKRICEELSHTSTSGHEALAAVVANRELESNVGPATSQVRPPRI